MSELQTPLTIVAISLILSAFFSGMEIAFFSSDKLAIELEKKKGKLAAKIISNLYFPNSSRYIGTTLIGNTVALVIYGIYMAQIMEILNAHWEIIDPKNDMLILLAQTIVSTIVVLFTAEFTPKSIFLLNPNGFLMAFSIPMLLFYYLLFIPAYVIMSLSKLMITMMGRDYNDEVPAFGMTDLNNYIKTRMEYEAPELSEVDTKIFTNALEFKNLKVRDCMIPRTDIEAVDLHDSIEELRSVFTNSGHSKIVVYKDSIDEVVGYCHSNSLFKKPNKIKEILQTIMIVTETMPAKDLMINFLNKRKSIALVVDEYGGTSGIVCTEDIMEEIFGEIQDEHDDESLVEQKIDESTYILSARHEIDDINEKYGWDIPTGEYDTIGGFILTATGNIPELHEEIIIEPYKITVLKMEDNRIDTVKLELLEDKNHS
ncbi:hemolysin family protein [Aureibacter tunicatorum]|uniref:CBS domain containing-hemolysin-like protein n=1 Tax=Aureibacter tunicatorum TaxID=866807 RepID=A0AAE3XIG0_9BACT|nr:hemolysin family protein [Aureibacter tunicatorum]MDR6237392.1 CBS domain containing-hemolysin-like protein [Aureibacter tunicatorum]BDD06382.1 hemolysin [Aureibacter tunicatorum]